MMTSEEYELLLTDEVQRAIAACRDRDPLDVALDRTVPHARLVATQVKYLARAASKLPSYAAAQCILPPLAFEQASSEACAAHKRIDGDTALDLTCGLGVDALFLSRRFRHVVTLERSEMLARIAAENFRRLRAANIEVVRTSAEEYLQRPGLRFDWIFADPDRRSADGRKQVRLEACSPDITALMPLIARASGRLCIKNSPLFDVDEALRLFPDSRVEVVSLGDECKEVLVYADGTGPSLTATALGRGSFTAAPGERTAPRETAAPGETEAPGEITPPPAPDNFDPARYRWLVVPDVALQKARLARLHLRGKADIWSENGYGFAAEEPRDVIGKVFAVESIEPYDPRRLKRSLKGLGAELMKRDFPLAAEELARRLGVRAGADVRLAFTKIRNGFWAVRLK
ncbi:MAG: class I SAM-dependent methyltransferase [Alistipes sp.]|uniref:THUMP-like domain-containing protein n=1 Tax=Alistipes sp. TaxID=1872444 RepID=UPI0025BAE472|nr:methyltransferase domain-containing protein [Alistipes sp.]MCD8275186.1 class I SAM-dependent methyltransferase [Alistipes sp.]